MIFRAWMSIAGAAALLFSLGEAPAAAAEKPVPADKMICKVRQRTGTRFGTKICRTATQWDQIAEEGRRTMKDIVDRPQINVCGPSGCD